MGLLESMARRMKFFLPKACIRIFAFGLLVLPVFCSCRSSLSREARPRAGQSHWGDEAVLEATVSRLLDSSRLASRAQGVASRYADFLRYWYQTASLKGQDMDGGVRMLNFVRQIHFQNGGGKSLWKQAVRLAKEAGVGEDGLPVPPIPSEYK